MSDLKEEVEKEWFAAFDPGKVNFAFIVEEIDKNMMNELICPKRKIGLSREILKKIFLLQKNTAIF